MAISPSSSSSSSIEKSSKIFVAGHTGLVGSAILRCLKRHGFSNLLCRTREELDLRNLEIVRDFFGSQKIDIVILAAAKVGGIGANALFPVEFLLENMRIQNNVISMAAEHSVKKLVFLGSSCVYPKNARYPLTEDQLLTGPFEPTNEAYALAKTVGIKLCEAYCKEYGKTFISVMPTNLYGPNDYYHLQNSHVIPAMLLKILKAKKENQQSVGLWGSGKVYREFLHSDDLAEAVLLCLEKYNDPQFINVGSSEEITIGNLAQLISKLCGYTGKIEWDLSKPDGVAKKIMDSKKIKALGWTPKVSLEEGLRSVIQEAERKIL